MKFETLTKMLFVDLYMADMVARAFFVCLGLLIRKYNWLIWCATFIHKLKINVITRNAFAE